jgi:hypothetical protein
MATVKVGRASDNEPKPTQKAKQTWYADASGVPTTDASKAAFHLAEKGQDILPSVAAKYGFVDGDVPGKAVEAPKAEAKAQAPTENKAVDMAKDQKPAAKK